MKPTAEKILKMARLAAENGQKAGGTLFIPVGVFKALRRDAGHPPDPELEALPEGTLLMIKNGQATVAEEDDFV